MSPAKAVHISQGLYSGIFVLYLQYQGSTKSTDDQDDRYEPPTKQNKLKKNPNIDTSFLPNREREEAERKEREWLHLEWLAKQEQMKKGVALTTTINLPEWAIAMHGSYESKFVIRNLFNIWRSNSGKIQQLDRLTMLKAGPKSSLRP